MKRVIILCFTIAIATKSLFSQSISINDTSITFKNAEGKILTKDELQQLTKGKFSIRQEQVNGEKIITVFPSGQDEHLKAWAKMEAFKTNLLNKSIGSFSLVGLDGKQWNNKELSGKVIVLNFWFTTCKPCITEMPHLNELVKDNEDEEVIFLAPAPENETQIKKFLKKYSFNYNIIPSSLDFINRLQVENFPTHLIIDKKGIIRLVFVGYADDIKEKLQAEIDRLIQ